MASGVHFHPMSQVLHKSMHIHTAINNSQMSGGERREREGETREGDWLGD